MNIYAMKCMDGTRQADKSILMQKEMGIVVFDVWISFLFKQFFMLYICCAFSVFTH